MLYLAPTDVDAATDNYKWIVVDGCSARTYSINSALPDHVVGGGRRSVDDLYQSITPRSSETAEPRRLMNPYWRLSAVVAVEERKLMNESAR